MVGRAHQLSNGLYVSHPPDTAKGRLLTTTARAVPYTGGNARHSGNRGTMVNFPIDSPAPSRSFRDPIIPHTGLITSGPIRNPCSDPGVTAIGVSDDDRFGFRIPIMWIWIIAVVLGLGFGAGLLVLVAVKKVEILGFVVGVITVVLVVAAWRCARRRAGIEAFLRGLPLTSLEPGDLPIGKLVKITGMVTCGNIALETSYQQVSRCIYTSTELYEYRGFNGKPANSNNKLFQWVLRHSEKYVADFYVSDRDFGMRFLIRAGNGAKVTPFVKPSTVVDTNMGRKDLSPILMGWLIRHNLSHDNPTMRLKEGFIKEGSIVSVMGVLKKHQNILLIDPPKDAVSTGCQWTRWLFPSYIEGIVLLGDETPDYVV